MPHVHRLRLTTVLAVLLLVASTAPAAAAPPPNDDIAQATPLRTPAVFTADTSEATASRTDGECVAGASAWYVARPKITRTVRLTTLGSDYDTVLAVYRGTRTNRTEIACVDDSFETTPQAAKAIRMVAGSTYWVAVSACCSRSAPGGDLVLRTSLPAPASLDLSVDSVEAGGVSGRLIVHGTATCATTSELFVDLSASQRVGTTNVARGSGFVTGLCGDGGDGSWTARVDSDTGWAFQSGTVSITAAAFAYDGFQGDFTEPETSNFAVTDAPDARKRAAHR